MNLSYALPLLLLASSALADCRVLEQERVQVTPDVVAFIAPEGTTGVVNGNSVAIIGKDAVLVVDPGQFPTTAAKAIAEIRSITDAPVRYVVNTHWHGDHLLANSVYRQAFPGVKLIAHRFTVAESAKRYGPGYAEKTRKSLADAGDFFRRKRASAGGDEREWIDRTFECVALLEPMLDGTRPANPDTAVDERMDIDLGGGVAVSVRHLGTGNTPGDLVVWVPKDRLVASGDILVHPAPYAIGSDLRPWPATIDRMLALSPAIIVPGHGPVMHDDAYARDVRALLASTQAQMDKLLASGVAKKDAAAKIDTAAFRGRYIATAMQRQAFEQFFLQSAVAAAWPKDAPPPPEAH